MKNKLLIKNFPESIGLNITSENSDCGIRQAALYFESVFDCLSAADTAAIGILFITAFHALNHANGWTLPAAHAGEQVASGQQGFQLALSNHKRISAAEKLVRGPFLPSCGNDNHTVLYRCLMALDIQDARKIADLAGNPNKLGVQMNADFGVE